MHKLITKKTNHTQNPREQNACEWETHPHTGIPIIMGSFHRRNVFLFFTVQTVFSILLPLTGNYRHFCIFKTLHSDLPKNVPFCHLCGDIYSRNVWHIGVVTLVILQVTKVNHFQSCIMDKSAHKKVAFNPTGFCESTWQLWFHANCNTIHKTYKKTVDGNKPNTSQ